VRLVVKVPARFQSKIRLHGNQLAARLQHPPSLGQNLLAFIGREMFEEIGRKNRS